MRRLALTLTLALAGVGAAAALAPARAAEPRPATREPARTLEERQPAAIPAQEAPAKRAPAQVPRPSGDLLQPAPEQAATSGPFFVDIGCDGQQLSLETQNVEQRKRSVSASHTGGVQSWPVCAKAGWRDYQWSLTNLQPEAAEGRLRLEQASGGRVRLVFEPLPSEYAHRLGGGSSLVAGKLAVNASRPSPQGVAQGLPGSRSFELQVSINVSDVPDPVIIGYWIDEYRPGRSGTLRSAGILDPAALAAPDASDGVVHIEGRDLNQPPAEIFIQSSAGRRPGSILSRTTQNGMDRVVVQFSNFRGGSLVARNPWNGAWASAPRLHYRALDADTLGALASGLSIVVGSPAGKGRVTMGESERAFEVAAFEQSGANVGVVDLRSSAVSFAFLPGAKPDTATLRLQVDFETAGEEIDGSWRAAQGAPPVDVGGHLTSPRLEVRTQLKPASNGARLTGAWLETKFSFGIQLTAAGVGFPLGPLEDHVRKQVNQGLLASMQKMKLHETLATAIDALLLREGSSKIREVEHYSGKLFVDMVED